MTRQTLILALTILICGLGLTLKAERYAGRFVDHHAENERRLAALLAIDGWLPAPQMPSRLPFHFASFAKPGCPVALLVAALGDTSEMDAEIRLAWGDDVALVDTHGPAGVVAISPAPANGATACSGPPLSRWQTHLKS